MTTHSSPKRVMETPVIPDRLYFKIGDVARICKVETYVLRFWETQFPQLKPNKSGTGQRLYRKRDVETALEIKRLVHGEGFTLAGARQALGSTRKAAAAQAPRAAAAAPAGEPVKQLDKTAAVIGSARAELREILSMLAAGQPAGPSLGQQNLSQQNQQVQRRRPRFSGMHAASGSLFPQS